MSSASPFEYNFWSSLVYSVVLVVLCTGLWCFCFLVRKFCNVSDRTTHDVELGLPRSPSQASDDDQQEHKAFKEVSWAVHRNNTTEEITKHRSECVICMQEFKDEDECRVRSKCNHIYHKICIDEWLATHRNCPYCRGSVRDDPARIISAGDGNEIVSAQLYDDA